MGQGQSAPTNSSQSVLASPTSSAGAFLESHYGFQILRVHSNSPVSECAVHPYFDYIIAVNSVEVSPDMPNLVSEMARNHVNKPMKLRLYNSRQDELRECTIVPRTGWGGDGLLGCSIRLSPMSAIRDRVWHVLSVLPNSPAEKAGLRPMEDYIIGCPSIIIKNEEDFSHLLTQNTKRPVDLMVFRLNSQSPSEDEGVLRQVTIIPDFGWGGDGCVGCDVGAGMIHWIPAKAKKPSANTETLANASGSPKPELYASAIASNVATGSPSLAASLPPINYAHAQPISDAESVPPIAFAPVPLPSMPPAEVVIAVPNSRPVIDNLSSSIPVTSPSNTTRVPFPLSSKESQGPSASKPASPPAFIPGPPSFLDDIPPPNFSVESDVFAATAPPANPVVDGSDLR